MLIRAAQPRPVALNIAETLGIVSWNLADCRSSITPCQQLLIKALRVNLH
jgi:hypothetical protein